MNYNKDLLLIDVLNKIRDYQLEKGVYLNIYGRAKMMNISHPTYTKIEEGKPITEESLTKVCNAMNVNITKYLQ